jgi:hypothetical protein
MMIVVGVPTARAGDDGVLEGQSIGLEAKHQLRRAAGG